MIRMMLNDVERAMKFEGKVAEFFVGCLPDPVLEGYGIRLRKLIWNVGK